MNVYPAPPTLPSNCCGEYWGFISHHSQPDLWAKCNSCEQDMEIIFTTLFVTGSLACVFIIHSLYLCNPSCIFIHYIILNVSFHICYVSRPERKQCLLLQTMGQVYVVFHTHCLCAEEGEGAYVVLVHKHPQPSD